MLLASGFIYSDSLAQNTPTKKDKETSDKIIGVWNIKDMDNGRPGSEAAKAESKRLMADMLKDSYLYFKNDGTFEFAVSGKEESGTWRSYDDGKKLLMKNSTSTKPDTMLVESLTAAEFNLSQRTGNFYIKLFAVKQGDALNDVQLKSKADRAAKIEERRKKAIEDSLELANAYKALEEERIKDSTEKAKEAIRLMLLTKISGKNKEVFDKIAGVWGIKTIDEGGNISKMNKDQKKIMEDMLKDSYMYFNPNGMVEIHVSGSDVDGEWTITDDGKKLQMTNENKMPETFIIQKISKTEIVFSMAMDSKFKMILIKQGNALTNEQQEKHIKNIALHTKQMEDYHKQAYADSVAALRIAEKQMHDADSTAKALEAQAHVIEFAPCYYLKLICAPFEMDASKIMLEKVSEQGSYESYKCMIFLPDAIRSEYGFENSSDRPRFFNAVFGENLSEKNALELYNKELAAYKQCKTEMWKESVNRDDNGRWSYTEISGDDFGNAKELSIEMNIDEKNKTYNVRLHLEEE